MDFPFPLLLLETLHPIKLLRIPSGPLSTLGSWFKEGKNLFCLFHIVCSSCGPTQLDTTHQESEKQLLAITQFKLPDNNFWIASFQYALKGQGGNESFFESISCYPALCHWSYKKSHSECNCHGGVLPFPHNDLLKWHEIIFSYGFFFKKKRH